jgi:hypothetical protein
MTDRRAHIPSILNLLRGSLGDAGITHSLKRTKNGWPYIRFEAPSLGIDVSVQYRNARKNGETKEVRPAHFLVFLPGGRANEQKTRSFPKIDQVIAFLGIDEGMMAEGRVARATLSAAERAMPVMSPEIERSYIAMLKR